MRGWQMQQEAPGGDNDAVVGVSSSSNSNNSSSSTNNSSETSASTASASAAERLEAFARISQVLDGSPSSDSGMKVGDLLLSFGGAVASNHRELSAIAEITRNSIGRPIQLRVRRTGDLAGTPGTTDAIGAAGAATAEQNTPAAEVEVDLSLTPHTWSGPGVLGCRFLPL